MIFQEMLVAIFGLPIWLYRSATSEEKSQHIQDVIFSAIVATILVFLFS